MRRLQRTRVLTSLGIVGLAASGALTRGADVHLPIAVPYGAEYEEVTRERQQDGSSKETRRLSAVFRDRSGRWRHETAVTSDGETLRVAMLIDFAKGKVLLLDVATGQRIQAGRMPQSFSEFAAVRPQTPSTTLPRPSPAASPAPLVVEELGERAIEGITATGRRITTAGTTTEIWTSAVIDQPALWSRTVTADREEVKRLFNIKLTDPNPELFRALDEVGE